VRIFNTYGPRMHPNDGRVVSNFIVQALQNRDITIYGDGSRTRSFCYVDDLVTGLVKFMDASDSITGPLNLGNPHEITVRELADIVISMTGSASKLAFHAVPVDDPRQRRPDISRANELLDWQPLTPLKQGLQRTIEYFERALSANKVPVSPI
jgi:UDP-glucuronate decarboxylase